MKSTFLRWLLLYSLKASLQMCAAPRPRAVRTVEISKTESPDDQAGRGGRSSREPAIELSRASARASSGVESKRTVKLKQEARAAAPSSNARAAARIGVESCAQW